MSQLPELSFLTHTHPAHSLEKEVHAQHQSSFRLEFLSRTSGLFTGLGEAQASAMPIRSWLETSLTISDMAPPPLSVGGIPSFEGLVLVLHGDMVPQCFSTDPTSITDELWRKPWAGRPVEEGCRGPPRGDPDSCHRGGWLSLSQLLFGGQGYALGMSALQGPW